MLEYQWYFPINAEGGQPEGLNDSGVESFRGNQIESLAREIIQNSTDAILDRNNPVKVSFSKFTVKREEFPDREGLSNAFESSLKYKRTPEQAKVFFAHGLDMLEKNDEFTFLRVSDYNTKGLQGVNVEGSDWENLVKSVGISNKGGSAGGSFGIGKSAPFACSILRTVFYSTLNINGEEGFQGVSRLASHKYNNEETRGTGFYGIKSQTKPITNPSSIKTQFKRTEVGTDVYIAAFLKDEDWKKKIIRAVIENFFISIHERKLVVTVGEITIDHSSLKSLIDKYIQIDKGLYADQYLSAIKFGRKYTKDIAGLGEVDLYIKKDEEYAKRVALVRNTGMKITHMDRFRVGFRFSGVSIIRGEKLNQLLRKTEPPTHDKWESSRHENEDYAKKVINELRDFIRETIKEMSIAEETNKIDFKGFNQFLPDHLNEEDPLDDSNKLVENHNKFVPKAMKISARRNKKRTTAKLAGRKKGRQSKHDKNDIERKKTASNTKSNSPSISIASVRSIEVGNSEGIYDLKISTNTGGKGNVTVNFVGEDSRAYKADIKKAVDLETGKSLVINQSQIGPISFNDSDKKTIRIELNDRIRASLEVLINES